MAKYRKNLPQLSNEIFLTDGGLETTLIFHEGLELPEFAAFYLLKSEEGIEHLREYYRKYAALALDYGAGFVLESVTWRANSDWGKKLGLTEKELADLNRKAIDFLSEIRDELETEKSKMVISGCIGPRGDGYVPTDLMTAEEAENYHAPQVKIFSSTQADLISAFTINYVEEAIGIVRVAEKAGMPVVISFTVETDGKLPTGQTLREAIESVDAATNNYPAYYMINCAHPTHFEEALEAGEAWTKRIRGVRANSSVKSHAELDESTELDEGNPRELGQQYRQLLRKLTNLRVLGGCCGTDFRHVKEIAAACVAPAVKKDFETV
jgi:S-methylmethionine-dependent homocysteine/selenocysteine methylase